ncbi:hypothetical protein EYB25_001108 [Talaromyces marneffei]|uniref:uncharacterized protein n=1 Tax=Talaromyces marneffei TaxID=37727 RepID=UPI0012A7DD1D|nr:uncharacterized protein EYB26_001225 [Talaromyces marneffei]KAE8556407.1 hypothetical protein EYB25_001108 [Talaromyces marneffei]QGA13575.1 hypothetical protein EYB26_001225 [Talaromyces marneffei]
MASNTTHNDHPLTASAQDEPSHIDEILAEADEAHEQVHEPADELKAAPSEEDSHHVSSELYHYLYFEDNDCFFSTHFS